MYRSAVVETHKKVRAINRDASRYGTFAEIGAGQEVARWFFRVGGASDTVAKTISAYDCAVGDAIYGSTDQPVSRERLLATLDHEFSLLVERLRAKKGEVTSFFVFANAVFDGTLHSTTIANPEPSDYRKGHSHGWIGVRFQAQPGGTYNDVILHVWLHDVSSVDKQEALGVLGVNLIYSTFYFYRDPSAMISSFIDELRDDRIEIDMLELSGPVFREVDNQWVNLELVRRKYTSSVIFAPDHTIHQAAEILKQRPVVISRGSFRPIFKDSLGMVAKGLQVFSGFLLPHHGAPLEIMEISLTNLRDGEVFDTSDYLARIDLLAQLGKTVMVSNRPEFYSLASHIRRNTNKPIALVLGSSLLEEIFDEKYYENLDGGLLEACGRLFKRDLMLFVYPVIEFKSHKIKRLSDVCLPNSLRHLFDYLCKSGCIIPLEVPDDNVSIVDQQIDIYSQIIEGNKEWEKMVPNVVLERIKVRGYFGYNIKRAKDLINDLQSDRLQNVVG
jgi:hypothetical protein